MSLLFLFLQLPSTFGGTCSVPDTAEMDLLETVWWTTLDMAVENMARPLRLSTVLLQAGLDDDEVFDAVNCLSDAMDNLESRVGHLENRIDHVYDLHCGWNQNDLEWDYEKLQNEVINIAHVVGTTTSSRCGPVMEGNQIVFKSECTESDFSDVMRDAGTLFLYAATFIDQIGQHLSCFECDPTTHSFTYHQKSCNCDGETTPAEEGETCPTFGKKCYLVFCFDFVCDPDSWSESTESVQECRNKWDDTYVEGYYLPVMTIASSLLTLWMDIVAVGVANPAIDFTTLVKDHDNVWDNLQKVIESMETFKDDTSSHSYWDSPGGNNYREYFNGYGGLLCHDKTPAYRYTATVTNGKEQRKTASCVVPAGGALTHISSNLDSMITELNILLVESRVEECYHKQNSKNCFNYQRITVDGYRGNDVTVETCQTLCSNHNDCVKINYYKQVCSHCGTPSRCYLISSAADSGCNWRSTSQTDTYVKGVCDRRRLKDSANNVARKEVSNGSGNSVEETGGRLRKM